MMGFLFGSACLVALAIVAASGHRHPHRRHFRGHRRAALFEVLDRIDATPGQEKAIREAWRDFADAAGSLKRHLRETREDVAAALRGEYLDEAALSEVFARHDAGLDKLKAEVTRFVARIHETLDERQRDRLADMVESGAFHPRHGCR